MKTQNRLTFKQVVTISDFLKTVVITEGDVSYYSGNWSDTSVASQHGVTERNVEYLREQVYPNFIKKDHKSDQQTDILKARVDALEARMTYLEQSLGVTSK